MSSELLYSSEADLSCSETIELYYLSAAAYIFSAFNFSFCFSEDVYKLEAETRPLPILLSFAFYDTPK